MARHTLGPVLAAAVVCAGLGCRRIEDPPPRGIAPPTADTEPEGNGPPRQTQVGTTVVVPDFAMVADRMSPSVVSVISTVRDRDGRRGSAVLRGLGSGLVVSARGQILTNAHVVADATEVDIELSTHQRLRANVIYADPLLDLALLGLADSIEGLTPVEFRDGEPRPGEWVMAVGQPFGLGHTVTVGVISGLGRDHDDLGRPPGLPADGVWSFIQTDASINIGNSGGPLVGSDGKVVGITTAVRSDGQGLAFAIPATMARRFLEEVWTYGRVRHPRLGIRADNAGPDVVPGRASVVRVTQIDEGGPGAQAGLEIGDFILAINDEPVTSVSDVAFMAQLLGVGNRMTVTVKHGDDPVRQILLTPVDAR